jgi:ribose 1,5-bisphosphokinase PhnN
MTGICRFRLTVLLRPEGAGPDTVVQALRTEPYAITVTAIVRRMPMSLPPILLHR